MALDMPQLSIRVREVLLKKWDPIGIQAFSEAQNEYDSYVPELCELLMRRATVNEIVTYLWWLETEHMGLPGDRQKTEGVAAYLTQMVDQET